MSSSTCKHCRAVYDLFDTDTGRCTECGCNDALGIRCDEFRAEKRYQRLIDAAVQQARSGKISLSDGYDGRGTLRSSESL